jgi:hypothetical protein
MPTLNPAKSANDYQETALGTAGELSLALFNELEGSGYSLIPEEVWQCFYTALSHYAGWSLFEAQLFSTVPVELDESLPIYAHEWTLIKPLARAECDVIQAPRMEADRSMGMEGFGIDVVTATNNLKELRDALPKASYVCEPEFIELE